MPRADASRRRCAIYTRKSSEEGLEQEFNSLAAQREACEAYIRSQQHEGWLLARTRYDDGGFSGGNMERAALQRLLADIRTGRIDIVIVYKVDRLTRSLADFARLVELFDSQDVSFVSVTQQFNTTSSMGRLTLNVLLSFAQFEREVTGEWIRDKIAASKKKGMWMGWERAARLRRERAHARRQPCRGGDGMPCLRPLSRARLWAPGQGGGRLPRAQHEAQHDCERHRARRQTLLARAHLQTAVEPDLHRSDCAQGPALPRTASGVD